MGANIKDKEIIINGRVYIISNGRVFDKEKLYNLPFFESTKKWLERRTHKMPSSILGDVKGIDPELHLRAKVAAVKRKVTIAQWYNEALANQLKKEERKEGK